MSAKKLSGVMETEVVTTRVVRYVLGQAEILDGLGLADQAKEGSVNMTVMVPGGGDWSNEKLTIGVDAPLVIEITTSHEHGETYEFGLAAEKDRL